MIKRIIFKGTGQAPDLIGIVQNDDGNHVTVLTDEGDKYPVIDTYTHQELLTMARDGDVTLIRGDQ